MTKEEILKSFDLKIAVAASPIFIYSQMALLKAFCKNVIVGTFPNIKAKIDFGKQLDSGAKAWKMNWSAGQGVTGIKDTVAELNAQLGSEFKEAYQKHYKYLEVYR